ncbi:MAG: helix-turn-helix domain-containing protein [Clostridia bacterium]|nr:helix-turn-helix domain-containing protein [Clostridia bacterium]
MINAKHTLRVPAMDAFEMKYYYSREEDSLEARTFPPHIHDVPELYILAEGNACFAVENRFYRLSPGDVIVTRPNEMHNCVLTEKTVHKHLCLWFEPSFALLEPLLEHCRTNGNQISPSEESGKRILSLCEELSRATEEKKHRLEYALLCRLLCELEEGTGAQILQEHAPPKLLTEILRDINENFAHIESVNSLTERYFISPSTLGRIFRENLHTSPKRYLETKKLAYSRILLREGKSVAEACMEAGFGDVSGYIRLFRNRFGTTPGQYRKNQT